MDLSRLSTRANCSRMRLPAEHRPHCSAPDLLRIEQTVFATEDFKGAKFLTASHWVRLNASAGSTSG